MIRFVLRQKQQVKNSKTPRITLDNQPIERFWKRANLGRVPKVELVAEGS